MKKVYILQESSTRDGLNFDYFCKDVQSLKALARKIFLKMSAEYDDFPEIKKFLLMKVILLFIIN